MTSPFSPTRAAFEGFRVLGRNPLAFLVWTGFILAVWVVLGGLFWLVAGADLMRVLASMAGRGDPDWAVITPLLPKFAIVEIILLVLGAFSAGVLYNAIARAVLRPDESDRFYLRFGPAELRAGALYLLFGVATFALIGLGAGLTWSVWLGGHNPASTVLAGLLAFLVVAVVWVFCAVRLCLAMPQVLDTGRIDLKRAWRLSKEHFGPLIGMSLLIILITYAVQIVLQVVMGPMTQGFMVTAPKGGVQTLFAHLAANWPMLLGLLLLLLVFGMAQVVIRYAPYALAYRDLARINDPEAFAASEF